MQHTCKLCKKSFAQLPHLKKHMLCVHNTDKPYYCERCETFFKVKLEYQEHVEVSHPDDIPEDLVGVAVPPQNGAEQNGNGDQAPGAGQGSVASMGDIQTVEFTVVDLESNQAMPMEKMRTLLALLLKKISTPGRLKKLGFGTRLIDDVLRESIQASGREPFQATEGMSEQALLKENIQILLDWTIPEEYMAYFKAENKSVDEILEELAT